MLHALAHLLCGLVGEGDCQDVPGRDTFVGDQVGDAVRYDARLAGAGAGENEQRAFRVFDGSALFRIERRKEVSHEKQSAISNQPAPG